MEIMVDNEHITAEKHTARHVIVVRRKATRTDTPDELVAAYQEAIQMSGDYRGWGLVVDLRLAPGRNENDFEQSLGALREQVDGVFPRVAMLLSTAVGELHARRVQAQREVPGSVSETLMTRDLDAAMKYAAGD